MSDHQPLPPTGSSNKGSSKDSQPTADDPLFLLDECLADCPEPSPHQQRLYQLRHLLLQDGARREQQETEFKKLTEAVETLTAPANRIGTLLGLPQPGIARILVGGGEFYARIDPRLDPASLKLGTQILVNEAYVLLESIGYDTNGPVVKVKDVLPDGRVRIDQDLGRQQVIVERGDDLRDVPLKGGDEIRLDSTHRFAIEHIDKGAAQSHVLEETPLVTWEQIGGQQQAIESIRHAIEFPLLHANTFARYQFSQPKGFLLHGPPGCGKTLIGQATAAGLAELASQHTLAQETSTLPSNALPPISKGSFLHIKGPEILNMWVGESERMVRDLFAQARARRNDGFLPVIFIDEAESILGTRRALRAYNMSNTLVPMFCAELDGIDSLLDVVVILASNRPDLIDPAILRPGRIDRKIKVVRPSKEEAAAILRIYLPEDLPLDAGLLHQFHEDHSAAIHELITQTLHAIFQRSNENQVLSIRLRNGSHEVLYRGDLISGAILSSIVRRGKERAILRTIHGEGTGMGIDDLLQSVNEEFQEGEILPPDDSAEEWLKLLDHHPDQVVGISPIKRGRQGKERELRNII